MQFLMIILDDRDAPEPDPAIFEAMGEFAGELAAQGKILGGSPLTPEQEGARVRQRGRKAMVTDGPFTETKEVIGGYFLVECESRDEALEIAKRCPHVRRGTLEVREVIPMGPPD
jgi:hypothetical protein